MTTISVLRNGKPAFQPVTSPAELDPFGSDFYGEGKEIPLEKFEPGYYTFVLGVRDLNASRDSVPFKGFERRSDFVVLKADGSMPDKPAPDKPAPGEGARKEDVRRQASGVRRNRWCGKCGGGRRGWFPSPSCLPWSAPSRFSSGSPPTGGLGEFPRGLLPDEGGARRVGVARLERRAGELPRSATG